MLPAGGITDDGNGSAHGDQDEERDRPARGGNGRGEIRPAKTPPAANGFPSIEAGSQHLCRSSLSPGSKSWTELPPARRLSHDRPPRHNSTKRPYPAPHL